MTQARYRKTCLCPAGAVVERTGEYIFLSKGVADAVLPEGNVPVCLKCKKEWMKVDDS